MTTRTTPYWDNVCGHRPEDYVGSTEYFDQYGSTEPRKLDLHLYPDTISGGQGVCIRLSNEPSDYISPGSLADFLGSAGKHTCGAYFAARRLLLEIMEITARKKPNDSKTGI
jgi:hypothetical protein